MATSNEKIIDTLRNGLERQKIEDLAYLKRTIADLDENIQGVIIAAYNMAFCSASYHFWGAMGRMVNTSEE